MVTLSTITYDQTQTLTTEQKFAWLYARERDVRAYLLSLVGSTLAEDVLQTVWEKVWKALPRTEQVSYSWLRTIAANAVMDYFRKQQPKANHASSLTIEDCAELMEVPPAEQPEAAALAGEATDELLAWLTDDATRAVVLLAAEQPHTRVSAACPTRGPAHSHVKAALVRARAHVTAKGA